MKGIYLAAHKAYHENYYLDYNDIKKTSEHINIIDDMLNVDLSKYDYIIATPPCNYWSRANYRREISEYSQATKHLLPDIIDKLIKLGKPFIVENVKSHLFKEYGLYNKNCFIYEYGRHTWWTNIPFIIKPIKDTSFDYKPIMSGKNKGKLGDFGSKSKRQGGKQVHNVIEYWLEIIHNKELEK